MGICFLIDSGKFLGITSGSVSCFTLSLFFLELSPHTLALFSLDFPRRLTCLSQVRIVCFSLFLCLFHVLFYFSEFTFLFIFILSFNLSTNLILFLDTGFLFEAEAVLELPLASSSQVLGLKVCVQRISVSNVSYFNFNFIFISSCLPSHCL